MWPFSPVTVVIPSYNAGETIRRAIDSAIAESPLVDEVIVIDDGSNDDTRESVRGYDQRVVLVEERHRGDPAIPRNIGIRRASNAWVAFLDADDMWLPGKIAAQVSALREHPDAGLVCTNAFRQTERDVLDGLGAYLPEGAGASGDVLPRLLADNFVITSSVLASRAVIEEVGGFHSGLAATEDYGLWLRVARVCQFVYVQDPWLVYRDFGWSYRREWSPGQGARAVLDVLDQLEERFPGTTGMYRRAFRERRSELYGAIGRQSLATGDKRRAVRAFAAAVCETPDRPRAWKRLLGALAASDRRE